MAITKTGITLSATGEADKTFELDGQQSSVSATDLTPNKQYTVAAYIVDSGWGKIDAAQITTFTTLPEGQLTLSNVSAVWGTQTAQLTFSCNWASTYNVPGVSNNFKLFVSQTADFSAASEITPSWTRQSDGLYGSINATLTQKINTFTPNSDYYVKVQLTDIYGEVRSETFHYYTPTSQTAGAMSFTTNLYNYSASTTSTIYTAGFTYALSWQTLVYTDDNWATMNSSGSWQLNQNITTNFHPNYWTTKLQVVDIYGNKFLSSQTGSVDIVKPELSLFDTHSGSIYYVLYLNPQLAYDTANLVYSDGGTTSGTIDLLPTISENMYGDIPNLPDGTYEVNCKIAYDGTEYAESGVKTITIQMRGGIHLEDTSELNDGILYWSANFTSTFPMATGTVRAYKDDDDYELLGSSAVTFDGTTSGTAKADDTMDIGVDSCVIIFNGTDTQGFGVSSEYWI